MKYIFSTLLILSTTLLFLGCATNTNNLGNDLVRILGK